MKTLFSSLLLTAAAACICSDASAQGCYTWNAWQSYGSPVTGAWSVQYQFNYYQPAPVVYPAVYYGGYNYSSYGWRF